MSATALLPHVERAAAILLDHEGQMRKQLRASKADPGVLYEVNQLEAAHTVQYLDSYGYLPRALADWKDITLSDILDALKKFQSWFGLAASNVVTPQALRTMVTPRCGCPDIIRERHLNYRIRQSLTTANQLAAWSKRSLTYAVESYVPGLSKATQEAIIQKAFDQWTQYCNLSIRRAAAGESPDIIISIGQGAAANFDGPGGVLAWAYLPDGGDGQLLMRFDAAETWTTDPTQRGILMLNVACHEFGHLLGLTHSQVSGALMAPYYSTAVPAPQANDDIPRIQSRYGKKTPVPPPPPPPVDPTVPVPTKHSLTLVWQGPGNVTLDGKQIGIAS